MRLGTVASFVLLSGGLLASSAAAQNMVGDVACGSDRSAEVADPVRPYLDRQDGRSVCTDFYQYACGNWKKNNPIPAGGGSRWGRFNDAR